MTGVAWTIFICLLIVLLFAVIVGRR